MGRYDHLDESVVRERPSRRNTRPRSKDRPAHEDAVTGVVVGVDRGRYTVRVQDRTVVAMRARELGRTRIVVGDVVGMVGDTSGDPDTLARIVRVEDRRPRNIGDIVTIVIQEKTNAQKRAAPIRGR